MIAKVRELLSPANIVDPLNNLLDVRLFGSVLRKPYSQCNDIDVLFIVKESNPDTLRLRLRDGTGLTSRELNTAKGKGYAKAPEIFPVGRLPLHLHHCSTDELRLDTVFNDTFRYNNVSLWSAR